MRKMAFAALAALALGFVAEAAQPKLILHMDFNTVQRTKAAVVGLLREASAMGYNAVLWEIEDKVKWDLAEIAGPEAFTKAEFREILAEADRLGLEPIPLLQVFGHGEYILTKKPYVALRENPKEPDCYCVSKPETFEFQKKLLAEYLDLFGLKVKWFHLGADEAYGFAKCPVCSKRDKMELYLEHLERVSSFLAPHGIRCGVWHDLICGDAWWMGSELKVDTAKVPRKYVVWMWDYLVGYEKGGTPTYADKIPTLQKLGFDIVFAGATSSFLDGPFLPGMVHHRLNLAKGADLARTQRFAGFAATSWSIRQHLRALQLPLFRFAAKRFLDPAASADADWAAALKPEKLGLTPTELDAATVWGERLTRFDGRAFCLYKDGTKPSVEDFRTKVLPEVKLPPLEQRRVMAGALARGAARSTGAWKEAFGLQLQTLEAAETAELTKGKEIPALDRAAAVRHLAREQAPQSAADSADIIWGFYPPAK